MAYTFCDYMLDALADLREHEEDPATRQALFAAIQAFVDEHLRHSGQKPSLSARVIDMVDNPDDEEECNSVFAGPCNLVPSAITAESKRQSTKIAYQIMDDLELDLLRKHAG